MEGEEIVGTNQCTAYVGSMVFSPHTAAVPCRLCSRAVLYGWKDRSRQGPPHGLARGHFEGRAHRTMLWSIGNVTTLHIT